MDVRKLLLPLVPGYIKEKVHSIQRALVLSEFKSLQPQKCQAINLMSSKGFSLQTIFGSPEVQSLWNHSKTEINNFDIPDGTGGVNPGDRRAIYYLIGAMRPSSTLEIGTHIGASTVHIASALFSSQIKNGHNARLTTLDIRDVNSAEDKPWLKYGTKYSPKEMIDELNYGSLVNFVADQSLKFLANTEERFDFIFLDGDHSAATVYQEIPLALNLLNKNGVILLHDYYPLMNPLWANRSAKEGPCRATERLIKEGADLVVLPLGELPWPTKFDSNITSLALLMRKS